MALAGSDLLVCMIEYRVWFLGEVPLLGVGCGVRWRVSKGVYRPYYHYRTRGHWDCLCGNCHAATSGVRTLAYQCTGGTYWLWGLSYLNSIYLSIYSIYLFIYPACARCDIALLPEGFVDCMI